MSALTYTLGDTRTFQLAATLPVNPPSSTPSNWAPRVAPVDLTGVMSLTFVLQRMYGSVGAEVARWGLGSGVALVSPPTPPSYYTQAMLAVGWASQAVGVLTVTPAMVTWVRPPSSWTGENPWASDTQLRYTWSLVDALGNATECLETGTFTMTAGP